MPRMAETRREHRKAVPRSGALRSPAAAGQAQPRAPACPRGNGPVWISAKG